MKLFIKQIIIWPVDPSREPRVVTFDTEKISVISGWSSTGKSSIISIIDYVLGAKHCSIPVGEIRDRASWYGLLVETSAGLMRLARKKPDGRQVDNSYWLQEGSDAESNLPVLPVTTTNADRVRAMMDTLSGLSDLRLDPEQTRGFNERASFRDMAAFNFLPQHIVANPYTLFFKADSSEHREKLRNVLPLALGVITNADIERSHRIQMLREDLRKQEADLHARRTGIENWRADATGAFFRAQELNLLPPGEPPTDLKEIVELLKKVVGNAGAVVPSAGRVSASVERLEAIRSQEMDLDSTISSKRRRLRRLKSLRRSVSDYAAVLEDQQARVKGSGWFLEHVSSSACVLCGSQTRESHAHLEQLAVPIRELTELTAGTETTSPMVDSEIIGIQRSLIVDERNMLQLRRTRAAFEATVEAEQGHTQSLEGVYRFLGNIEQALRILGDVEGDEGLTKKIADLEEELEALRRQSDEKARREKEASVRTAISDYIVRFVEALAVTGATGTPLLDEKELNVKFKREGMNRPDFLWEIGSGENWMAYHLAALLALHGTFLRRRGENPVPTFLVIDQPSQVYFPSDTFEQVVEGKTDTAAGSQRRPRRHLDDLESTRRIFSALSRAQRSFKRQLQIIVLDHADEKAWGQHDNVFEAGNWRGDEDFLIPTSWLT
ncbi:DUF3732 domain-containing protein [Agrobacterium tumefaciens]|uniref:DUF3732 domain-containing protein n=1 Tax=Agrobacterium tumefaciens TaxID=358 RepID=A0A546XJD0_AGRTU|nr:DUF3732 domain-containing protein [Agrobacterium tumefaciens]TRB00856.1 DUF3732 domain-containing protein [Agrobacterium tumefaciens]